jgi:hypothetical protein
MFAIALPISAVHAFTDQEMSMWHPSGDAPLTFTIPSKQGKAVMAKAQDLISTWTLIPRVAVVRPMKIQTASDNLIQTTKPSRLGDLGFNVTREVTANGDEISVSTQSYYERDETLRDDGLTVVYYKDSVHAAHFLAYLLQQYAATLTVLDQVIAPPSAAAAPAVNSPAPLPTDLDMYLTLIRQQLAAGNYDTAISTIDALKSAVGDKERASSGATPPASPTAR